MKLTVRNVIAICGGTLSVAYHLNVHQVSVERWQKGLIKIPPKYWPKIAELSGGKVSVEQLQKLIAK